jgi:putative spermidine/putrescine transport system permease protein
MAIATRAPSVAGQPGAVAARPRLNPVPYLMLLPSLLFALSLLAACLIVFRYSFNSWSPSAGMVEDWTTGAYTRIFADEFQFRGFLLTLQISLTTTVVCLVLAYPVAYLLSISRHKNLLLFLIIVPLMMDVLVRAYGWIVLLNRRGLVNQTLITLGLLREPAQILGTETAVILELLHEVLPFTILPLASVLQKIDPSLREAAVGLGASKLRAFWRVTLPLSLPGVLAGTLLTFALAMSAFVAPLLLGAGKVFVMSILIQQQMLTTLNWPLGAAQSVLLVALVSVLLLLYMWVIRKLAYAR